ncbi:hypothetical protein F1721_26425 [Saccharopolyspora hirsuta]|uniref:Uncharacterized protein n=1 Tax=Saccharopolyspora hirsuta TaxID=1837 RepID=A0A5M7BPK6_SACHI|nr:hypothetical protein [Saccharopolyspora hirsuta]KAA5829204.1 hypothetical protein F1721_26425 [Saccharopolyspora hirsuta]
MSAGRPQLAYLARGAILALDGAAADLESGECTSFERERLASCLERVVGALRSENPVITIRAERTDR